MGSYLKPIAMALIVIFLTANGVPLVAATSYSFTIDNSSDNLDPAPDNWLPPPPENPPGGDSPDLPDNSLVGYWSFDENTGSIAHDNSGLGNDGEIYWAAWVGGKAGAALEFDGNDDYVTVPSNATLNPVRISATAWLYPTQFPAAGEPNDHFLGKWESGGYQYIAYLSAGGEGEVRFQVTDGSGRFNESRSNMKIPLDNWSHFAVTWDGSNIRIYINGVEGTTVVHKQFTGDICTGASPMRIGLLGSSGFRGRIDEIYIYSHAMSGDEVVSNYQQVFLIPTALTVTPGSFSFLPDESVTLTATLTSNGLPLSGKTILWSATFGSIDPSSGTTDSDGRATATYTGPSLATIENLAIVTTSFAGDSVYRSSTASARGAFLSPPIGYWSFDEGEENIAHDYSGLGHNGTIYGATWVPGKIGNALSFDGDDTVDMGNVLNFERDDTWTVAAWVKTDNSNHGAVVAKIMGGQTGYDFFVVGYTHPPDAPYFGKLAVHINHIWGGTPNSIRKYSDIKVDDNEWHHIAYTYDGSSSADGVNIYIDGVLHNGDAFPDTLDATILNDYPLRVGSREGINYFRGIIDEVRIYSRVLTLEEVRKLYRAAADNTPPSSSVLPFEGDDYWKELDITEKKSFTVRAAAVDDVGVENVELWYRCSLDNWTDDVAWKKRDWRLYGVDTSPQPCGTLFEDEFDGQTFDQTKWDNAYEGNGNVGRSSIQLHDSQLHLEVESPDGPLAYYLRSNTAIIYGALEVRAKAPSWDNSDDAVDWVRLGFMSTPPLGNDRVVVALNCGVRFQSRAGTTFTDTEVTGDLDAREYHTYKIIWSLGEAKLYVDGALLATHEVGIPSTPLYPILLTYSGGAGDNSELWVDYVRVRRAYRAEWEFVPDRYGYYEFFSVATDAAGNREDENAKMLRPGEANVRVAKDVVRVAAIPAKPKNYVPPLEEGLENFLTFWREDGVPALSSYYTEVSYGAVDIRTDVFTRDGGWFELSKGTEGYKDDGSSAHEFMEHAIDAAISAGVPLSSYQIVAIGSAYIDVLGAAGGWASEDARGYPAFVVEATSNNFTVAHETGHVLGDVFKVGHLPDLSSLAPNTWGDISNWGLMGNGFVHLSSWSKERLGWLEYEQVDWVGTGRNSWEGWVDALPTLGYRGEVYKHRVVDWELPVYEGVIKVATIKTKTDYLLEVRTRSPSYSEWDTDVPGTGLVLYEVDEVGFETWLGGGSWTWVTTVGGSPFTESLQRIPLEEGVYLRILENRPPLDPYQMRISARRESENQLWAIMRQVPIRLSENVVLSSVTSPLPDLDLHAYTSDGRHVGVNYETGEYEIEIENALSSGDRFNGGEWIQVPAGVEAYFSVSAHDVEEFLTNNPSVQLELENGIYAIGFRYHDNRGERYESAPIGQVIRPGAEISNPVNVVQNPDGTYSVGVDIGWDMFDLAAWKFVIDNLSDNIFIKNPAQRKNALKEKFEEVFEELDEADEEISENDIDEAKECYQEAADKLANDILKKLDADGKADWVRDPVLVDEFETFITVLKHKASGGED